MSIVIILDVDHTLVHAKSKSNHKPKNDLCYIESKDWYVYLRPHLYDFLDNCFKITPYVILWSAGTELYIDDILNFLQPTHKFYRTITRSLYDTVDKNVDLLLTDDVIKQSMVIFIDDIVERIKYTADNVIVLEIKKYEYKDTDNELENMISIIEDLTKTAS